MPLAVPRVGAREEWAAGGEGERDRLRGRLTGAFPPAEPRPGRNGSSAHELTPDTLMPADQGCGVFRGWSAERWQRLCTRPCARSDNRVGTPGIGGAYPQG
ncbi:hypothetical protein [Streptomyces sp. NPDC088847]|uniref:hypothetical protein n=1 Tax=Streptomyces sp. NPDC088847 TaxID=3365909 RepID=UPI003825DA98